MSHRRRSILSPMRNINIPVCASLLVALCLSGGCETESEFASASGAAADTDALDTDALEGADTDQPVRDVASEARGDAPADGLVETSIDPEGEEPDAGGQEFRATPRVYVSNHHRHLAGNIVPETHRYTVGGACSANHVRSSFEVDFDAFGNCSGEWASNNPTDCRVAVTANTMAFWGAVNCYVSIWEERSTGTCGRRGEFCGGASLDESCYCDMHCETYGDCCIDYQATCE